MAAKAPDRSEHLPSTQRRATRAGPFGGSAMGRSAIRAVDPAYMAKKPIRSPKSIDPSNLLKTRDNEVKVFLINLEMMLRLVRQAREVDTNKPKIKPMRWNISSYLLGDLLVYLTLHAQRHVLQAQAVVGV